MGRKNLLLLLVALLAVISCTNKKQDTEQEEVKTITLTKKEFLKKIVNYEKDTLGWRYLGDKPAVIDFYAKWCGPCKAIAPTLEKLAQEYEGKIYIYKINVDKEPELAEMFGIESIPTLFFIPMEGEPTVTRGMMTRSLFKEYIDSLLIDN
jgi:thioredoxin